MSTFELWHEKAERLCFRLKVGSVFLGLLASIPASIFSYRTGVSVQEELDKVEADLKFIGYSQRERDSFASSFSVKLRRTALDPLRQTFVWGVLSLIAASLGVVGLVIVFVGGHASSMFPGASAEEIEGGFIGGFVLLGLCILANTIVLLLGNALRNHMDESSLIAAIDNSEDIEKGEARVARANHAPVDPALLKPLPKLLDSDEEEEEEEGKAVEGVSVSVPAVQQGGGVLYPSAPSSEHSRLI